jgi:hypothetical protein
MRGPQFTNIPEISFKTKQAAHSVHYTVTWNIQGYIGFQKHMVPSFKKGLLLETKGISPSFVDASKGQLKVFLWGYLGQNWLLDTN